MQKRKDNIGLSPFEIQQKMLSLMEDIKPALSENQEFKACYGWLKNFMKRKNLVIIRISGSDRGIPLNCQNIIQNNLQKVNKLIKDNSFEPREIFNFDESSFYICSPGNYTVEHRGSKKSYVKHLVKK